MPFTPQLEFTTEEQRQLHQLGVKAAILFGSRVQGIARKTSDYDVFVIGRHSSQAYDTLYNLLSEKINQLVNIDLVFQSAAPMELQNHVAMYGIVLFQEHPSVFLDFKAHVMETYADFAPLRHLFQQATLERIMQ